MTQSVASREAQITLRDFLMVLFRRKWTILAMVLVTSSVVFSAILMAPIVYVASSKMMVIGAQRGGPFDRTVIVLDWEQILSSESELITSRPILQKAQEILDQEAAQGLPKVTVQSSRVRPSPVPKSRILNLSYGASSPGEAQRVCNAVTNAYMEYHRTLFAPADLGTFFRTEIQKTQEQLSDLLTKRLEAKESSNVVDVGSEMTSLFTVRTNVTINLVEIERQIAALRSEIGAAEEALRTGSSEVPYTFNVGLEFEAVRWLEQEYARKQVEREELLSRYTERHPQVRRVEDQMAEIRTAVAEQVRQMSIAKKAQLASLESEREILREKLSDVEQRLSILPAAEREISETQKAIDTYEKHFKDLYYMGAQASAGGSSTIDYHVHLLSPPGHGVRSNPPDVVRMTLGPILSLLVGIGLAFFFDNLDHSLKSPEEVERYLGLPVLTSVKRRRTRELSV
jgi:uncharacterized protein involved in exopolysaccharide biosynthesis